MPVRQVKRNFISSRPPTLPERINEMVNRQRERFKEHPEEARELSIKAGVITRSGRLTKPYRMMIKRDLEEAAQV